MKVSLAGRLFGAIFGISALTVGMVIGWTAWALNEGFSAFVSAEALEGQNEFTQALRRDYEMHRGWSGIAGHPEVWAEYLTLVREPGPPPPPPPGGPWPDRAAGLGPPPHMPPSAQMLTDRLRERLVLFDATGRPVAGGPAPLAHAARRSINLDGRPIGSLLLDAGPMPGGIQAAFLQARLQDFLLAGAAALALSAIAAIVLARSIVRPVHAVMEGARRLAASDFTARIDVQAGGEIGDLITHFNALAAALDTAEQSRRLWVADTSHELRTPLAVLRAHIEAMQDGVQPATPRALAVLHSEVMRMTQLVADLHELSRADAGALSLHMERLCPAVLFADVLATFSNLIQERRLVLDTAGLSGCDAEALADDGKLRQVFVNLVENAVRYTDEGGTLRASACESGLVMTLRLEDSAPGVPPAKLPRLFERFFRAEHSRSRATGGSGLGLAICRVITEAHGGTITAAPSSLGGLAITVELPVAA